MFWPTGLSGRVSIVVLVAIGCVFAMSAVFYVEAENYTRDKEQFARIGERLAVNARVLSFVAIEKRAEMARTLSAGDITISWLPADTHIQPQAEDLLDIRDRIIQTQGFPLDTHFTLVTRAESVSDVVGAMQLADRSVMAFIISGLKDRPYITRGLFSALMVSGIVLLVAVALIRVVSLPLRSLAHVADTIGRGPEIQVSEDGPREVRYLARAINSMQERINQLISDRTLALAAVSHDLRTPLSRLRLRAGFIEDMELQKEIEADAIEMEAMLNEVLSFLADKNSREAKSKIDLADLLKAIIAEVSAGRDHILYSGPEHYHFTVRPLALKRVILNLIDNALKYATQPEIVLIPGHRAAIIVVKDKGPGISHQEVKRVMTPFYRIEGSRSRATGGVGLGLAIVAREVERDGGTVALSNREGGGLKVKITLPLEELS
ncbi:ATP-binding protein [Entomobacter blattae]|uniref:histidine kinase n=1 Tax=Entomobacter blattae TaxID=2762277 RepID=A0A7H1NP23_9PROT|nr:ATP-binding protein [Entomobacter blattae]QNT77533.1 Adaptive-response sensory-kinase SasA [Entomobacter blattae]